MATFPGSIVLRDVMDMPLPELAAWWNRARAMREGAPGNAED